MRGYKDRQGGMFRYSQCVGWILWSRDKSVQSTFICPVLILTTSLPAAYYIHTLLHRGSSLFHMRRALRQCRGLALSTNTNTCWMSVAKFFHLITFMTEAWHIRFMDLHKRERETWATSSTENQLWFDKKLKISITSSLQFLFWLNSLWYPNSMLELKKFYSHKAVTTDLFTVSKLL